MTQPVFGLQFNLTNDGPLLPAFGDFSVLGIVLPSSDADAVFFPLNIPVDVNTGDPAVLTAAGTGDLYKTLIAVNNQLVNLQRSARAVIVRVAEGGNAEETMSNIIGSPAAQTGIYALLRAPSMLGVTPRLLGFPGYTGSYEITGGSTSVTRRDGRHGGNVGNGVMTLASPAYLTDNQPGDYIVTCIGGTTAANGEPGPSSNTGGGTIGTVSSNAGTTLGSWRIVCNIPIAGGGNFNVYKPNGNYDGLATVGSQYTNGVGLSFKITAAGNDFVIGDEFIIAVSEVVPANGGVFSVADPFGNVLPQATVGTPYADQIGFTIADGTTDFQIGDMFIVTVANSGGELLANPLCAALPAVCEALMACAIVDGPGSNKTNAILWQTTLASKRLIPIDDPVIPDIPANYSLGAGETPTYQGASAAALGIGVAVDFAHQGFPFWSFANHPIQGILGTKRVDSFSLVDGATDGQELLAAGVGVVVRGDHSDASLTDSGWSLISYMNASTDPFWNLLNKVRGRDFIHLALLKSIRKHLGKDNITPHAVQAVLNDMTAIAMYLMAQDGCMLGFSVGFSPDVNTPAMLRNGAFRVFFNAEQPAPILLVTVDSGLDYSALVTEIATLATSTITNNG